MTIEPGETMTVDVSFYVASNSDFRGVDAPRFLVTSETSPQPLGRGLLWVMRAEAPLRLGLQVSDETPIPGEAGRAFVKFGNPGAGLTAEHRIKVSVPAGMTVSAPPQAPVVGPASLEWTLPTLGEGVDGERWFAYTVDSGFTDGDLLPLRAELIDVDQQQTRAISERNLTIRTSEPLILRTGLRRGPTGDTRDLLLEMVVANTSAAVVTGVSIEVDIPEFTILSNLEQAQNSLSSQPYGQQFANAATCPWILGTSSSCQHGELLTLPIGTLETG